MENLIVYPENENQLKLLKDFLEETKIRFKKDSEVEELEDWQKRSINEGLKDIDEGRFSSSEEVHKKALECLK